MASSLAPPATPERRLAVIDMGSNTFRLVVYRYREGGSFQLVDEIREAVRLSQGATPEGLRADAIERAAHTTRLYAAFVAASGVDDVEAVATSAARDAANGDEVMAALSADGTLRRAHPLGRGGGLVRVSRRRQQHHPGRRLRPRPGRRERAGDPGRGPRARAGRVASPGGRAHDRALPRPGSARAAPTSRPCASTWRNELGDLPWLDDSGGRTVGIGGTIRTLARMHQRRVRYPLDELHGYQLTQDGLQELIEAMAELPAGERSRLPGLKPDRADITLAGAVVISAVLERIGVDRVEICAQGLREGIFYERFLAPADPPLIPDVRRQSVLNLVETYRCAAAPRRERRRPGPRALRRAGAARPADHGPPRARAAVGGRRCSTTRASSWTTTTTTSTASTWC